MLIFDVYLGPELGMKHLVIFDGEDPEEVALKFTEMYNLNSK